MLPAVAAAASPEVVIEQPVSGSSTNNQMLPFSGTSNDTLDGITLTIHDEGSTGPKAQTLNVIAPLFGTWETAPASPLADGKSTAVAEQTRPGATGSAAGASTAGTASPTVR